MPIQPLLRIRILSVNAPAEPDVGIAVLNVKCAEY